MSWKINGTVFKTPSKKDFIFNTQQATNRTISGANNRDYIGAEKALISAEWEYISKTDYAFLKAQYDDQRLNHTTKTLVIDEEGVNMNVIIDLMNYSLPLSNHYNYRTLKIDFIQQ